MAQLTTHAAALKATAADPDKDCCPQRDNAIPPPGDRHAVQGAAEDLQDVSTLPQGPSTKPAGTDGGSKGGTNKASKRLAANRASAKRSRDQKSANKSEFQLKIDKLKVEQSWLEQRSQQAELQKNQLQEQISEMQSMCSDASMDGARLLQEVSKLRALAGQAQLDASQKRLRQLLWAGREQGSSEGSSVSSLPLREVGPEAAGDLDPAGNASKRQKCLPKCTSQEYLAALQSSYATELPTIASPLSLARPNPTAGRPVPTNLAGSQQSSEGPSLKAPRKPSAHQLPKAHKAKQGNGRETAAAAADCQSWPVYHPQLPAAWQLPQQQPGFPTQQQPQAMGLASVKPETCAPGTGHTTQVDLDAHVFAPPAQLQPGLLGLQFPVSPLNGSLRSSHAGQISSGAGILGQPGTDYLNGAGLWTGLPSIPEGPAQSSALGLSDPSAQASAPSEFEGHQAKSPSGSSRSTSSADGNSVMVVTVRQGTDEPPYLLVIMVQGRARVSTPRRNYAARQVPGGSQPLFGAQLWDLQNSRLALEELYLPSAGVSSGMASLQGPEQQYQGLHQPAVPAAFSSSQAMDFQVDFPGLQAPAVHQGFSLQGPEDLPSGKRMHSGFDKAFWTDQAAMQSAFSIQPPGLILEPLTGEDIAWMALM